MPLSTCKNISTKVSITPMPQCCVPFLLYFGAKNDSCDGKNDYGFASVAQSCIYNNCDNKF